MTATREVPSSELPYSLTRSMSRKRRVKDRLSTVWLFASLLVALIPLGLVIFFVVQRGSQIFSWDFLTQDIPANRRKPGPGMGPAIVGTLIITGAASVMAIPLGILGASTSTSTASEVGWPRSSAS